MTAEQIAKILKGKKTKDGWMIICPAHADKEPSCALSEGESGKILVHCFAGCKSESIIDALKQRNLWPQAQPKVQEREKPFKEVSRYIYKTRTGANRLLVRRLENEDGKKQFRQSHWDGINWQNGKGEGEVVPFNFELWRNAQSVLIVEGEKCVEALNALGVQAATCIPGGANAWQEEYAEFFQGKQVVVIPDNDDAGNKFADEVIASILPRALGVKRLSLPNLERKEDIVEWIEKGGTQAELYSLILKTAKLTNRPTKWKSVGEDILLEHDRRKDTTKNKIEFGISYLDSALSGIMPNDLILVGAKTGGGKSELVTSIAHSAIHQMKRVYQFSLEAEEGETTSRLKYRLLANEFYKSDDFKMTRQIRKLNYVDWYEGKFDDVISECEKKIDQEMAFVYENYYVRYKTEKEFSADQLVKEIEDIKHDADLIIVDHFHYLDFDGDNENKSMTKAASTIRQVSLAIGIPIILVAHVRKSERKGAPLVPDIEDFHGTSNLSKICTKAIMIAPAYDQALSDPTLFGTYMKISKMRRDNSRSRYCGLVTFDVKTNSYQPNFVIGQLFKEGQTFTAIKDPAKMPYWAKSSAVYTHIPVTDDY
jgi:5S rRNA maturation endonuclease (ribonuclease M5)